MRRHWTCLGLIAAFATGCTHTVAPATPRNTAAPAATAAVVHLLNRTTFGIRPGDIVRVERMGFGAYVDEQLDPERLSDDVVESRVAGLSALSVSPRAFAHGYYEPMASARQEFASQRAGKAAATATLRGHLLPVAALTLPGGNKPVAVVQQPQLTPEEVS